MKIFCLQSHPIQYFSPLYKTIEAKSFCEFKVFYCSDSSVKGYFDKGFSKNVKWDIPLLEGYSYEFLKNYSPKPGTNLKFYNLINPGIISAIFKEKPDIVWIYGWSYITTWFAIIACLLTRTKIWLKCESPLNQELNKSGGNKFLKTILLRYFLFKIADKFLYIGEENKDFYLYHNVSPDKLIYSPYAVDNDRFSKAFNELINQKYQLCRQLDIPENKTVILFSGKLIRKKRPLDLLNAFLQINSPDLFLIFLGDGDFRGIIETQIQNSTLKNNIIITGFINQNEIPKYYAIADIFVLPSTIGETWGLVINEAMNFALPIITSDMVGCAKNLVENGSNGYIYPVGNINILAEKIKELCSSKKLIKKFGAKSKAKIKPYCFERIAKEIENSIK